MSTLFFFGGLCLGSLCGFLLALLVVHGRAQSLAEEMLAQRTGERSPWEKAARANDMQKHWSYARRHSHAVTPINGMGMD
jgi:hypothetical protein